LRQKLQDWGTRTLLEVGCATGVEYEGIREAGLPVTYTGLDLTPAMLELARQNFPEATWVEGRAEALPFADDSFEVVLLRHVLEHLSDYQQAVFEAVRVASRAVFCVFFIPPSSFEKRLAQDGTWWNQYSLDEFVHYAFELGAETVEFAEDLGPDKNLAIILHIGGEEGE
jgi:ubiquinone/menaquinone biosynthesis C-methylase UbiE